jgi:hypothetical protein
LNTVKKSLRKRRRGPYRCWMHRPSSQSWIFEYIAAVTRKMSNILTATENLGTQGGRAALICLYEKKRLASWYRHAHLLSWSWRIPVCLAATDLGAYSFRSFSIGRRKRRVWMFDMDGTSVGKMKRRSVCHGSAGPVFVPASIRY